MPPQTTPSALRSARERIDPGFALLSILLIALLWGAITLDRTGWATFLGDEPTYLMSAESLAWDFDLQYSQQDYERFESHWQRSPEGLILQSGNDGETITYGKPFFYPLYLAPFVRISPTRGPFVANALLLSLVALVSAVRLRPTFGRSAPVWVALFLFGSITFAHVFWAHADLFLMAMTALGLSLAFGSRTAPPVSAKPDDEADPSSSSWHFAARWLIAGAALGVVGFSRPLYLPILIPAFFAPGNDRRRSARILLVGGAVGLLLGASLVHIGLAGSWTSYGAARHGFYASTGYPAIDFSTHEWAGKVSELGNAAWVGAGHFARNTLIQPGLLFWNAIYFLVGRHIGVIPYFMPLLVLLIAPPKGTARWLLVVACVATATAFFLIRPFNFFGGGAALANRYFLPLYPAIWFAVGRPLRKAAVLPLLILAAPFMWPAWAAPHAYPRTEKSTYRYVSAVAKWALPYETTQSHLKPGGRDDVMHNGLWVKFLTPTAQSDGDATHLLLTGDEPSSLLIGTRNPQERLYLSVSGQLDKNALKIRGATVEAVVPLSESGQELQLRLDRVRATHPMWWTWKPYSLYLLTLEPVDPSTVPLSISLDRRPHAISTPELDQQ